MKPLWTTHQPTCNTCSWASVMCALALAKTDEVSLSAWYYKLFIGQNMMQPPHGNTGATSCFIHSDKPCMRLHQCWQKICGGVWIERRISWTWIILEKWLQVLNAMYLLLINVKQQKHKWKGGKNAWPISFTFACRWSKWPLKLLAGIQQHFQVASRHLRRC